MFCFFYKSNIRDIFKHQIEMTFLRLLNTKCDPPREKGSAVKIDFMMLNFDSHVLPEIFFEKYLSLFYEIFIIFKFILMQSLKLNFK